MENLRVMPRARARCEYGDGSGISLVGRSVFLRRSRDFCGVRC